MMVNCENCKKYEDCKSGSGLTWPCGAYTPKHELNCIKCHYIHPENGNCTAVGGFYTAVPATYCPLIPELLARAEAAETRCKRLDEARERANEACAKWEGKFRMAEARVRELETTYRIEICDNGPECVELGKVRKALAEAEARAEKAERERDAAIRDLKIAADDNGGCYGCKWLDDATGKCTSELGREACDCKANNMWEWRGQKEE